MGHHRVLVRLASALVAGLAAYAAAEVFASTLLAAVVAWTVLAFTFSVTTWLSVRNMSPEDVRRHAMAEEPGRRMTHLTLVGTSLASLGGVAMLLSAGSSADPAAVPVEAIVGTLSVAASWLMVHMIFTLRYATAYFHCSDESPVDFGHTEEPDYQDFAYLSYTLGMTYQVSDTTINARSVRRVALRHALLSYLLGAVVIASTINVVVQLASGGGGS